MAHACGLPSGRGDLFFAVDGECASYAISTREPYGVWGGLSEHERERIWRGLDHSPYAS